MISARLSRRLVVVELDLNGNPITSLNRSSFPVHPQLRRLSMENCYLDRVERMTFRNLELLEILELSRNRIRYLDESAFYGLPSLRELRLGNNQLDVLPRFVFRGALSLTVLDLSENKLRYIPDETFDAASIESLNLDGNQFENIQSGALRPLGTTLNQLSISHNFFQLAFAVDAFMALNLSSLVVSSSKISDVSFLTYVTVQTLDLSGNAFGAARFPMSSTLSSSCRVLKMHGSQLTKLDENLAASLRRVQQLDLHNNTIVIVNGTQFRSMPDLQTLDLSLNVMPQLASDFSMHFSRLQELNLSRSGLRSLSAL